MVVEIRDHVGIDREFAAAAEHIKNERAILPRGTELRFRLTVESGKPPATSPSHAAKLAQSNSAIDSWGACSEFSSSHKRQLQPAKLLRARRLSTQVRSGHPKIARNRSRAVRRFRFQWPLIGRGVGRQAYNAYTTCMHEVSMAFDRPRGLEEAAEAFIVALLTRILSVSMAFDRPRGLEEGSIKFDSNLEVKVSMAFDRPRGLEEDGNAIDQCQMLGFNGL